MPSLTGRRLACGLLIAFCCAATASAQHEGHVMPGAAPSSVLGIPMDRGASGTSWIPDAVQLPTRHFTAGPWMLMLHGFAFLQYDRQSGTRGGSQFGSLNWGMFMASRPVGHGTIQLRTMLSLDPWTVTSAGYPLLLQTGETHNGVPIVDRQHPHDFWKELAVMYERPLSANLAMVLYGGPSGEPALGPVAFMHRPSGMDGPTAPLGHHQQDATHISYGVATVGVFSRSWKLEASAFNGREPDERRFAMDHPKLDSYSGRLTINPSANWSATLGYGFLASPEALHPEESVHRVVGSVLHSAALRAGGHWASSLVVGGNRHDGRWLNSVLLESEREQQRNIWNVRLERVERTAGELAFSGAPADKLFSVNAVSAGYIRDLIDAGGVTTGVGMRATVNLIPGALSDQYGSRTPAGLFLFLRVRPVRRVM